MAVREVFEVVAFTEPQNPMITYETWPAHLPLLSSSEGYRSRLVPRLREVLSASTPPELAVVGEEHDEAGSWLVIDHTAELQALRTTIYRTINGTATLTRGGERSLEDYRPAIRRRGPLDLSVGARFPVRTVSLIGWHEMLGNTIFNNIALAKAE